MQKGADLFSSYFGKDIEECIALKPHSSDRRLFRLRAGDTCCLLAVYDRVEENRAFIAFSQHFKSIGLSVPTVYKVSDCARYYLLEDFGDDTLFILLKRNGVKATTALYKRALDDLLHFQFKGVKNLPTEYCYDGVEFDEKAILQDLHYMRDELLEAISLSYDRDAFEKDCLSFATYLGKAPRKTFMFRDFQARNIMLNGMHVSYIDYQRGCLGPPQYDVATLLYQSQAQLPKVVRESLLSYYTAKMEQFVPKAKEVFWKYFYECALIRLIEVLGTYGQRGLSEKKEYFLHGIPSAIDNINQLLDEQMPQCAGPELIRVLRALKTYNLHTRSCS